MRPDTDETPSPDALYDARLKHLQDLAAGAQAPEAGEAAATMAAAADSEARPQAEPHVTPVDPDEAMAENFQAAFNPRP